MDTVRQVIGKVSKTQIGVLESRHSLTAVLSAWG